MSRPKTFELTMNEHMRLDAMLEYFGKLDYQVRITLNHTDMVEVIDRQGRVIASGKGFILDDAMTDLINVLNKVGFF